MCELILVFQLRGATKIDLPACFFFLAEVAKRWGPLPARQPCASLCACAHVSCFLKKLSTRISRDFGRNALGLGER